MTSSSSPLPVTIIGGYLGSTKTSLVNRLLRHSGVRLAVLVNEFGDLAIDEDLIESRGEDVIALAGGCVCCSYGDDMTSALTQLANSTPPPEHVVLEASGVALPGAIAATTNLLPNYSVWGVIVLADATDIRRLHDDRFVGDTIVRQLDAADLIILTKGDLVSREQFGQTKDWLQTKTPQQILESGVRHRGLPPDLILGVTRTPPKNQKNSEEGDNRHSDIFASRSYQPFECADVTAFAAALADCPALLRAKGFVRHGDTLYNVQIVGQRFEVTQWTRETNTGIAVIGLREGFEAVEFLMESEQLVVAP